MSAVTERTVTVGDVDLHVWEAGEGPLVVLCHGFPELGYSWRHQIPALAAAGYHVVAPDQRGYGQSSRPPAIEDYDIAHLTGDMLGLVDALGEDQAVFVGHDWGSMVVWSLSQRAPERMRGVVGMSVPFVPRGEQPPIKMLRQLFGETFFYMVYFQEPGVADANLGGQTATFLRRMMAGLSADPEIMAAAAAAMFAPYSSGDGFVERLPDTDVLPEWLSQDELDHYIAEFERTGFTGGINWYRNMDRNWELMADVGDRKVEMPAMFLTGTADPVMNMTPPGIMDGWVTDLRETVLVEGAGHWVQQEAPDEVNAALLRFLRSLD